MITRREATIVTGTLHASPRTCWCAWAPRSPGSTSSDGSASGSLRRECGRVLESPKECLLLCARSSWAVHRRPTTL
eukprot:3976357-Pyramimonas_sp.AAC.2